MKNSNISKLILGCFVLALVAGCSVEKTPVATGGSKADGSIVMSYDVGPYESPVVDWDVAQVSAVKRCRAWGYRKAEAFEGVRTQCNAYGTYGCMASTVHRTYQCHN